MLKQFIRLLGHIRGAIMNPSPSITPQELRERLASGEKLVLLDVREPSETAAGHIEGAQLIPMRQVEGRLDEIAQDRPVVCICHAGGRSHVVQQMLLSHQIEAINLTGGMAAWKRLGK